MAALNFPTPTTVGEVYQANGKTFIWNGTSWVNSSSGYTGSKGSLGYTGSRGFIGYTGSQGTQGLTGFTGSQGTQGLVGFTGSRGTQGATGFTGSRGLIGFTGSRGTTGFTGSRGATGFTGSRGLIGFTGSRGIIGFTGSRGPSNAINATNDISSTTGYPVFVTASGSVVTPNVTTTKLIWNASAGTLTIVGSLLANSKSFKVPHPTKEGKMLIYGSLEGPEYGVYVRGRTTENVIELPEYWTALVDSETITVSLTPIGKYQKLYVVTVIDNKVWISNEENEPINCYYDIVAERKDIPKLEVEV